MALEFNKENLDKVNEYLENTPITDIHVISELIENDIEWDDIPEQCFDAPTKDIIQYSQWVSENYIKKSKDMDFLRDLAGEAYVMVIDPDNINDQYVDKDIDPEDYAIRFIKDLYQIDPYLQNYIDYERLGIDILRDYTESNKGYWFNTNA